MAEEFRWPRSRSEVLKSHERRSRTHRRAPFPPDRALAAAAHAAQAGRAGATSLGSARDARRGESLARSAGRVFRGPARVPGAPLQGVRDLPALRAALPLRIECRPGGLAAPRRAEHPRFPPRRHRAGARHLRGRHDDPVRGRARGSLFLPRRRHRDARLRDARQRHCPGSGAGHAVSLRARVSRVLGAQRPGRQLSASRRVAGTQTARCWRLRTTSSSRSTSATSAATARRRSPRTGNSCFSPAVLRIPGTDRTVALSPARVLPHAAHGIPVIRRSERSVARRLRAPRHADAAGARAIHCPTPPSRWSTSRPNTATTASGGGAATCFRATRASSAPARFSRWSAGRTTTSSPAARLACTASSGTSTSCCS